MYQFIPHQPPILRILIEIGYTLLILFFCFFVYYKTNIFYKLTKYKGIQFFRHAFLFFGFAYLSRLLLHLVIITGIQLNLFIPRRALFPISMIFVGYFSTMAILYLTYSNVWKKFKKNQFLIFANILAILISLISFLFRSHQLMVLLQLIIIIAAAIVVFSKPKKIKKISNVRIIYLLLFIFWILNLFFLSPGRFIPFELNVLLRTISLVIFGIIFYKINNLIK